MVHQCFNLLLSVVLLATTANASKRISRSLEDYDEDELVPVIIGYENERGELHARNDANVHVRLPRKALAGAVRKKLLPNLQNDPDIRFVEYDDMNYGDTDLTSYALPTVQGVTNTLPFLPSSVSSLGRCSDPNVIRVAVVDSGLDVDHPDIQCGDISDANSRHCIGQSFGNNFDWFEAQDTHATHVMGLIAAYQNDQGVQGVVYDGDVCLLMARVFGSIDDGVRTSSLIRAMEWAIAQNATVVNMSISGPSQSNAFEEVIQEGYAKGTVLVASTGNTAREETRYPAGYDNVVAVTALNSASDDLASFATYGSNVDYAVAGVQILSTTPRSLGSSILTINVDGFAASAGIMTFSPNVRNIISGVLVDCGVGETDCPDAQGDTICFIERGGFDENNVKIPFLTKAEACEASGAAAAIIYNDVAGNFGGTLTEESRVDIPVVSIDRATGLMLRNHVGKTTSLAASEPGYGYADGTSFSTPIVAGTLVALRRSCPDCAVNRVQSCMASTATSVGNRRQFGNGIVQLQDAYQCLIDDGCCEQNIIQEEPDEPDEPPVPRCTPGTAPCQSNEECCSGVCFADNRCGDDQAKARLKESIFDTEARRNRGNRRHLRSPA